MVMGYAGDLGAREAYDLLVRDSAAVLVDVRTSAEWAYVGGPDLSAVGKSVICLEWQVFPGMGRNEDFVPALTAALRGADANFMTPVLFLCRSGARSAAAAERMAQEGFLACYNVAGGFEGDRDARGHRGSRSGWKAEGLPWVQS
ncbi:MAG: rhodanese-like domain-containing protein [Alphaproteobacteria bacterium]|nr:rhodanese-like domain-containing protein [Alphaproteobacteria bacterium]